MNVERTVYMYFREEYDKWLKSSLIDQETKNRLVQLDDRTIEDSFYKSLSFGTGGLRGIIGDGCNRMNLYTVRRATQGLSDYLLDQIENASTQGVAIAYDSRNYSKEFALEAALTLCENGIKAYLFESIRTTPELSFAVRYLNCAAGIVITASHNPKEYNGYKVYGADGGQITLEAANQIINRIDAVDLLTCNRELRPVEAQEKGLLVSLGEEIDTAYISAVKSLTFGNYNRDINVMYTPLHGTGLMPIQRCLSELGYTNISVLASQAIADGNFPTVKSPNPEEANALKLAIDEAERIGADLVLGTDPDCDRVGVAIKLGNGKFTLLTGNQIGALLIHYLLTSGRTIPINGAVVKTIVTSELGAKIAAANGLKVFDTLTGFKYIGEKISEFESTEDYEFVFGYEESYGYLTGTFVRDKDAVIATVLIVEMAAYYSEKGYNLEAVLNDIYKQYGYYKESLHSITLPGIEGQKQITKIMSIFNDTSKITKLVNNVQCIEDYDHQIKTDVITNLVTSIDLPQSDVLKFILSDGSWFAVRPSGTEPKIKLYFSVNGESDAIVMNKLSSLEELVLSVIKGDAK